MREIKFRAWDKELNRMCDVIQLGLREIIVNSIEEDEISGFLPIDRFEIMQYTGLKDKNGKDIYVSDILARDGYWSIRIDYEDGCCIARDLDKVRYNNKILDVPLCKDKFTNEWEVIGNIYENPELLIGDDYICVNN